MIILGIETSCDETALALIETRDQRSTLVSKRSSGDVLEYRIIESLVHSQAELHSAYGGVFPNLAKREHSKNLLPLLEKLLNKAAPSIEIKNGSFELNETLKSIFASLGGNNTDLIQSFTDAEKTGHATFLNIIPNIDLVAVTEGPGLEPALWVGINFARTIGALWNIPVMPINHMEGHVVGSLLQSDKPYGTWQTLKPVPLPSLALLISGGHTELVKIEGNDSNGAQTDHGTNDKPFKYTIIGQTKDDAVGEAFDKVARLLDLPYPGGPHISKLAHEAREKNIPAPVKLPRPMINSGDLDFSFSGLKTAVLYAVRKATGVETNLNDSTNANLKTLTYDFRAGLAREFEDAVSETLNTKLRRAIDECGSKALIVGGGVSANRLLRETFSKTAKENDIPIYLPDTHVSGDNALMIALVAASQSTFTNSCKRPLRADGTKSLL